MNSARVMRVMNARARAWVRESARANEKHPHLKYKENCRKSSMAYTDSYKSLYNTLTYLCYSVYYRNERCRGEAVLMNAVFTEIAIFKIKPVWTKPVGVAFVARSGRKRGNRQTDRQTYRPSTATLAAHARRGLMILPGNVGWTLCMLVALAIT